MKSGYKYFSKVAFTALAAVLVTFSAEAQRGGGGRPSAGGGGGGGGSVSRGGGGGFSGGRGGGMSAPSGGSVGRGGGGYSAPTGGSVSRGGGYSMPSRPSVGSAPSRGGQEAYGGRGGGSGNAPQQRVYSNNGGSYGGRGGGAIPGRVYSNRGSGAGYGIPGRVYSNRGYIGRGYGYGAPRTAYRNGYFYGSFYNGRYSSVNRFYGRSAFYNQFYYPRIGLSIGVLPYGYYPFWWGDYQYYYSDGYYYRQQDNSYTVVEPPMGAIMDQLPSGAKSLMIDGEQYYELNGVYYQAITKDDGSTGYQIAGKDGELTTAASVQGAGMYDDQDAQGQAPASVKIGDVFDSLPPNSTAIKIDGKKYYVTPDGIYYQEENINGRRSYRVAGTSDDQP